MKCNEFEHWLTEQNSSEKLDAIPEAFREHLHRCNVCANVLHETRNYFKTLRSASAPEPGDAFWEDYLSGVSSKLKERKKPSVGSPGSAWIRRLVLPVAAAAILVTGVFVTDSYYPFLEFGFYGEDEYSSTLDFIWEEHEQALSEHMFDLTLLYAVDEIIPENWEFVDPEAEKKK